MAAVLLLASFVVIPLANRWRAREARYAAAADQLQRLGGVVAGERALRGALESERRTQRQALDLLLGGASPALAASSAQSLLQRYATESMVQLNRVDVAGQTRPAAPGLLAIPVLLQGQGDIHGVADFLERIQAGEKLLVVDELSIGVRSSFVTGDQPLVWSLRAYGLYPAPVGKT